MAKKQAAAKLVEVVAVYWHNAAKHVVTLSDGTKLTVPKLVLLGFSDKKEGEFFLLPDGIGGQKQVPNAVPKEIFAAWNRHNLDAMQQEARRKRDLDKATNGENASQNPITIDSQKSSPYSVPATARVEQRNLFSEKQAMNLKRASVVALFEALEYQTAAKWTDKRLVEKIATLPKIVDGDTDGKLDDDQKKLLKKLLKAIEAEDEIVIDAGEAKSEKKSEKTEEKPAKKGDKKKPAAKSDDDDEDESEEEEDEDEEEKPAKKPKKSDKKKPKAEEADDDSEDDSEDEAPAKKPKKGDKKAAKKDADEEDEDESEEDEDAPAKKPKKSDKKKTSKKSEAGPSNKARVYTAWKKLKDPKKADPAKIMEATGADVKETTVKNWFAQWARGINLPGCANKDE